MVVIGYLLRGSPAICITETLPTHAFGADINAIRLLCSVNKCKSNDIELVGIRSVRVR